MRWREVKARLNSPGGWGEWGSDALDRYMGPSGRPRRKCRCGCGGKATHVGLTNGVALAEGCEFAVRRWVREGEASRG